MKTCVAILVCIILSAAPCAASDWEKIREEEDGITIFRKEIPGSPVLAFKGEGTIDAPLSKVATVIFDTRRAPEWVQDLEESRLVRWTGPDEFIEYDRIGTPFVMRDRDFVSKVKITVLPDKGQLVFHYRSVEDAALPETDFVRGDLKNIRYILTSIENGARTHILGEIHCDPMGSVPKWIVNLFQKEWPVNTLRALRRHLKKPDVREDPRFARMLRGDIASIR